jgi:hypothetical protein
MDIAQQFISTLPPDKNNDVVKLIVYAACSELVESHNQN